MSVDNNPINPSQARNFWASREKENTVNNQQGNLPISPEEIKKAISTANTAINTEANTLNTANSNTATQESSRPPVNKRVRMLQKASGNTTSTVENIAIMKNLGQKRMERSHNLVRAGGGTGSTATAIYEYALKLEAEKNRQIFPSLFSGGKIGQVNGSNEAKTQRNNAEDPLEKMEKQLSASAIKTMGLNDNQKKYLCFHAHSLADNTQKMLRVNNDNFLVGKSADGNPWMLKVSERPFARGNFGEVYSVIDLFSGGVGILKLARPDKGEAAEIDLKNESALLREANPLGKTPGIQKPPSEVFTYQNATGETHTAYLTPIYNGGKMFDCSHFKPKGMSLGNKLGAFVQILEGLDRMIDLGIKHGDIKPNNTLLNVNTDGTCEWVISDFGGCAKYEDLTPADIRSDPYAGGKDPAYMTPMDRQMLEGLSAKYPEDDEALRNEFRTLSEARDVYAMGRTLWQQVTGDEAGAISPGEHVRYTKEDKTVDTILQRQLDSYEPVLGELKQLIADMTAQNPLERISINEAKSRMAAIFDHVNQLPK